MLWDEPVQQGDALLLREPRGFEVLPLLTAASPSFSSFLLEKLPLNDSVQLLSAPRAGATEPQLEEPQPDPSCWKGKGPGQAQLPAGVLECTLHQEQADCAPELVILQTHPVLKRSEISSGSGGSSFVSLHVTHKVMGLLVMARKLNFNAC